MQILKSNKAFKLHRELINLKRTVESSGLLMGKILYEIQEQQLYSTLGYETFESYLADPELSFKRSTAYNLKKIYKQWVLDYGYPIEELQDVGYERLLEASKVATEKTKDDWLTKAKTLSRSDLEVEITEEKGGEPKPYPRLGHCEKCGKWKFIDPDQECDCS